MRTSPHNFSPSFDFIYKPEHEIVFSRKALIKQWQYVHQSDGEIGWVGLARVNKEDELLIHVDDVFLVEQTVTTATTDLDPKALIELGKSLSSEQREQLCFWGHSHVTMDVSPSSTDDKTMETLFSNCPWAIRAILNKAGKMRTDLFLYNEGLVVKDCEWSLPGFRLTPKFLTDITKEIKEKVSKKVYVVKSLGGNQKRGGTALIGGHVPPARAEQQLSERGIEQEVQKAFLDYYGAGGLYPP